MSYVDAIYNKSSDEVFVVERVNGQRVYKTYPATYTFFYEDKYGGTHKDMWGNPVSKFTSNNQNNFQRELRAYAGRKTFESDIKPVARCLEENYMGVESPILNIGFFDIEVDFDPDRGFANPWDPFSSITAISTYLTSSDQLITLVIKPNLPTTNEHYLSWEKAEEITKKFDNCILCNDEAEMLNLFLDLIEDCDVLSGWNSKGYDIPYTINRIERILGKEATKKMCLWGQKPRKKKYIQFKKEQMTYELTGRIHLDYLELYKKHNPSELHSYRLDYVGEIEVGENKTPYEGTLDALYKQDFERFIEYNRQDTLLLYKIDKKRRFIELANQIAHTNTVNIPTTMGSVALIEQSIINEAHSRGMCVPSRVMDWSVDEDEEEEIADEDGFVKQGKRPVVGAYVAKPVVGLADEIACCDINSLYPSALRSLNMGPETLVGQIRLDRTNALIDERLAQGIPGPECWEGLFATLEYDIVANKSSDQLIVDFEDGSVLEVSGAQLYDFIFEQGNPYSISANGTLFKTDVEGLIPGLLAKWYSQRKQMQFKETVFSEASASSKGFAFDIAKMNADPFDGEVLFADLPEYIKTGKFTAIAALVERGAIDIRDQKIFINDAFLDEAKKHEVFWNQRQQARKILLNSLYGALLNEGCRFYDARIGQSVTLTGRSITKHMSSKANDIIMGEYDVYGKAILYNDTDSVYFTAVEVLRQTEEGRALLANRDGMIQFYDDIGDQINNSFPGFMDTAFHTGLANGAIIKAGRELIASRGLFITKKRYALLMYDKDGVRQDVKGKPGKIKAVGLDLKRADTPKIMQDFLQETITNVLVGHTREQIIERLKEFRIQFQNLPGWEKGTPKKANGVTNYVDLLAAGGKVRVPGHIRAAINWNRLREIMKDKYSMEITDGQKVIVCKLRPNPLKMDSIAYPFDEPHLPAWYKELPFDHDEMEATIIDKKIDNLIGVLNWDLRDSRNDTTFNDLFSF